MPGIYIHIPFCKQACHYCDFHFSTSLKNKEILIEELAKEIELRNDYLENKSLSTIYFGGGTPSLLSEAELGLILNKIDSLFVIEPDAEITLEANPDDINETKISEWKQIGINRLSIGIQSFFDEDLIAMNRSHNSNQAIKAVATAQLGGIENISIDLIYGLPFSKVLNSRSGGDKWAYNLKQAFELNVPHLSCYCLTIEEKTAFAHFIKLGKITLPGEPETIEQFNLLMNEAGKNDFIHYEISNFCKVGKQSKHNSSYWNGEHYLGIGPSAHSFNGVSRQFNVANNATYIKGINSAKPEIEMEILTDANKFNEYIMTSLRTNKGVNIRVIESGFGEKILKGFLTGIEPYISNGNLLRNKENVILTQKGKLLADRIASDLFI